MKIIFLLFGLFLVTFTAFSQTSVNDAKKFKGTEVIYRREYKEK